MQKLQLHPESQASNASQRRRSPIRRLLDAVRRRSKVRRHQARSPRLIRRPGSQPRIKYFQHPLRLNPHLPRQRLLVFSRCLPRRRQPPVGHLHRRKRTPVRRIPEPPRIPANRVLRPEAEIRTHQQRRDRPVRRCRNLRVILRRSLPPGRQHPHHPSRRNRLEQEVKSTPKAPPKPLPSPYLAFNNSSRTPRRLHSSLGLSSSRRQRRSPLPGHPRQEHPRQDHPHQAKQSPPPPKPYVAFSAIASVNACRRPACSCSSSFAPSRVT